MKLENTEKILFNPLYTSQLLLMALSGAKNKELKMELVFYILPLVYNDKIKNKLIRCNSRSTFNTFLDHDVKKELIVIETLLANYKGKSEEALITLSNLVNFELSNYVSLKEEEVHYSKEKDMFLRESYKAAFNLGSILSKEDYKIIFFNL
jgi:hypothetical protein